MKSVMFAMIVLLAGMAHATVDHQEKPCPYRSHAGLTDQTAAKASSATTIQQVVNQFKGQR